MAWVEIEGKRFRSEDVTTISEYNGSTYNSTIRLRASDSFSFSTPVDEISSLIKEAEEKDRQARKHEKREELDYLARRIAENMVDMTRRYDAEREARETAKPKKPLKLNP